MSNPYTNGDQQPYQPQDPQLYSDPSGQSYQQGYQQSGYQAYPQQGYGQYQPNAMAAYGQPGSLVGYAPKSKIAAALLAFFLGSLGVHNFYLGYKSRAWWQLGLTIFGYLTCWLIIGIPFIFGVGVWAFVEFIMILAGGGQYRVDANGVPLTN